tara:strand:+ start:31727 stop:33859 length:2133 start_codon:yes stop_codon:yes gene_type:complete
MSYYGYKRGTTPRVDYGALAQQFSLGLMQEKANRDQQKADIAKAQRKEYANLESKYLGPERSLNQDMINVTEQAKQAYLQSVRLMRRGLISPSNARVGQQRLTDSFKLFGQNFKMRAEEYEEMVVNREGSISDDVIQNEKFQFGDSRKWVPVVDGSDLTNMRVVLAKRDENGNPIPGTAVDMAWMNNLGKDKHDAFDIAEAAGKIGELSSTIKSIKESTAIQVTGGAQVVITSEDYYKVGTDVNVFFDAYESALKNEPGGFAALEEISPDFSNGTDSLSTEAIAYYTMYKAIEGKFTEYDDRDVSHILANISGLNYTANMDVFDSRDEAQAAYDEMAKTDETQAEIEKLEAEIEEKRQASRAAPFLGAGVDILQKRLDGLRDGSIMLQDALVTEIQYYYDDKGDVQPLITDDMKDIAKIDFIQRTQGTKNWVQSGTKFIKPSTRGGSSNQISTNIPMFTHWANAHLGTTQQITERGLSGLGLNLNVNTARRGTDGTLTLGGKDYGYISGTVEELTDIIIGEMKAAKQLTQGATDDWDNDEPGVRERYRRVIRQGLADGTFSTDLSNLNSYSIQPAGTTTSAVGSGGVGVSTNLVAYGGPFSSQVGYIGAFADIVSATSPNNTARATLQNQIEKFGGNLLQWANGETGTINSSGRSIANTIKSQTSVQYASGGDILVVRIGGDSIQLRTDDANQMKDDFEDFMNGVLSRIQ